MPFSANIHQHLPRVSVLTAAIAANGPAPGLPAPLPHYANGALHDCTYLRVSSDGGPSESKKAAAFWMINTRLARGGGGCLSLTQEIQEPGPLSVRADVCMQTHTHTHTHTHTQAISACLWSSDSLHSRRRQLCCFPDTSQSHWNSNWINIGGWRITPSACACANKSGSCRLPRGPQPPGIDTRAPRARKIWTGCGLIKAVWQEGEMRPQAVLPLAPLSVLRGCPLLGLAYI